MSEGLLSDFLTLESVFSGPDRAIKIGDLLGRYGADQVRQALDAGDVSFEVNPWAGGDARCWLTVTGRQKATTTLPRDEILQE